MKKNDLKKIRQGLGLSGSQAAKQVRVHPRTWARYEAGDRKVPDGVFELFCIKNGLKYDE